MVDLLTHAFCHHDPIESALRITLDEFRLMLELELPTLLRNELCMVARSADSPCLVGSIIAMDAVAETVDSSGKISRKFQPIGEIARNFHDDYLATRNLQPGSCLYLYMIGVSSSMTGRGIATLLIREVLVNARARGYRSAFALTTNLGSATSLENLGFQSLRTLSYQTYRYQNSRIFSSITEHPGIALMAHESLADLAPHADLVRECL